MSYELPTNTDLNILLKILIRLLFSNFLNPEPHLLRRAFDKIEKSLNIKIAHNLDIEYLIQHLNAFDFDIGSAIELTVLLISHQHTDKLN